MCLKLAPADVHQCPRCGSAMHLRKNDSIQRTLALLITACLLYIPANLYPVMYTDSLGSAEGTTIMGGVVLLINLGSAPGGPQQGRKRLGPGSSPGTEGGS